MDGIIDSLPSFHSVIGLLQWIAAAVIAQFVLTLVRAMGERRNLEKAIAAAIEASRQGATR